MIKKFLLFLILSGCFSLSAQWTTVGVPFFSNTSVSWPFVTVDSSGTPYVAFINNTISKRLAVIKFNETNWNYVGAPGFSAGDANGPTLAFDKNGTLYVAYSDDANGAKTSVMKFNGGDWIYVGMPGFTPGCGTYNSIRIDNNSNLYIVFRDQAYGYRASVMKFNGSNWIYVGSPGFSSDASFGGASHTSLAIDKDGTLYVAYTDHPNNYKATVMKYDGNNWVYVGTPGFSDSGTANVSIAIDSAGVLYVAYTDGAYNSKATVMKFNGNQWTPVGDPGFTPGATGFPFIMLDVNGNPYVTYKDYANGERASVMKFDGTNWAQVGNPGFSTSPPSEVSYTTLTIDKAKNILYAGYVDIQYDTAYTWPPKNRGITVMKYEINNSSTPISPAPKPHFPKIKEEGQFVIPNPSGTNLAVNFSSPQKSEILITVTNSLSQTVYSERKKDFTGEYINTINLSKQPTGIYFVEVVCGEERRTKKIIVE